MPPSATSVLHRPETTAGPALRGPWSIDAPPVTVSSRLHEDTHLLLWQVHGSADLLLDGETMALPAGRAAWIPAGTMHSLAVRANSVVFPLLFDATATNPPTSGWQVLPIPEEMHPLLLLSLQYQSSIICDPEDEEKLLAQILALLSHRSTLPMPSHVAARQIAEALLEDPSDSRTTQELAAQVHVSDRTLERAFLQETGMTLHRWRTTGRMQAASRLLREGASIPAVASRVGYANVSAFGRVFKTHVGQTPRRYAQEQGVSLQVPTGDAVGPGLDRPGLRRRASRAAAR